MTHSIDAILANNVRTVALKEAQALLTPERPIALFSDCSRFRYLLCYPTGNGDSRVALGVFANPSTATADQLDPTCTRWVNYCRTWGYGFAAVANVRAWRETNPRLVPLDPEAIGEHNDWCIQVAAARASLVVCGWGKLGGARGPHTVELIRRAGKAPHALKLNKDGSPAHPLYLAGNLRPFPMAAVIEGERDQATC